MENASRSTAIMPQEEAKIFRIFRKNHIDFALSNGCIKFLTAFLPGEKSKKTTDNPVFIGDEKKKVLQTRIEAQENGLETFHWIQGIEFAGKNAPMVRDVTIYCPINEKTGLVIWFDTNKEIVRAMLLSEPTNFHPKMKIPCCRK